MSVPWKAPSATQVANGNRETLAKTIANIELEVAKMIGICRSYNLSAEYVKDMKAGAMEIKMAANAASNAIGAKVDA